MNNILTADELLMSRVGTRSRWITDIMIEFAKLHVNAALEAALDKAQVSEELGDDSTEWIKPESILEAYPKSLIR